MDYPEWAGYLAAFDAYVDARARQDAVMAEQARTVMGWFAGELLPLDVSLATRRLHVQDSLMPLLVTLRLI